MDLVYRLNFEIRSNDLDPFGRLTPQAILSMMQDGAGGHCNQLGLNRDALAPRGLCWVVTRHHVRISGTAPMGSTVTEETWPGETSRVAYPRSYVGYDEKGNELFRAISLWVLFDIANRNLVLPRKSGLDFTGISRGGELPVPPSLAPLELSGHCRRQVVYSELDCNGHMNNARYLDWVADLLPWQFHQKHAVQEFTICYLNEAQQGQAVDLAFELTEEGKLSVEAHQADGQHRVFALRASYL